MQGRQVLYKVPPGGIQGLDKARALLTPCGPPVEALSRPCMLTASRMLIGKSLACL